MCTSAFSLAAVLMISFVSKETIADKAGHGSSDDLAGLNAVPMMGKKDAAPREVPSFTSGYLPPKYPQYMRGRPSKREESDEELLPYTWHLGKRQPSKLFLSSWLGSILKPSSTAVGTPSKRSAVPSDWSSPWNNMLRSQQGFRFHEGGSDLFNRNLMYKRAAISTKPEDTTDAFDRNFNNLIEHDYVDYGGLMDDASLVRNKSY